MTKNTIAKLQISLSIFLIFAALVSAGCAASSADGQWASGDNTTDEVASTPNPPSEENPDVPAPIPTSPPLEEETPLVGLFFSFAPGTSQLAYGPGVTWNGCDPQAMVNGGYDSDTKCGYGLVHPNYADHLNKYFFSCVEKAAGDTNLEQPQKVFLRHLGTYVNRNARNSTSLSMHAYARAIDIVKFILYDRKGNKTQISTHVRDFKGTTVTFYNSFRQCWKETLPSQCKPGQREYQGSIGIPGSAMGGNDLHNDHIHLSFPLCAG